MIDPSGLLGIGNSDSCDVHAKYYVTR